MEAKNIVRAVLDRPPGHPFIQYGQFSTIQQQKEKKNGKLWMYGNRKYLGRGPTLMNYLLIKNCTATTPPMDSV